MMTRKPGHLLPPGSGARALRVPVAALAPGLALGGAAGISVADLKACRETLRQGSRSFLAASWLLPKRVHEPAAVLYAFCRLADDVIDGPQMPGLDPMIHLRERLSGVYAGTPWPHAADRALAAVVARHDIPRLLFDALLEGFEWDRQGRRYRTAQDLLDYAARVAGTVGAMMCLVMGARTQQALARACDLGVAMQLSNIARDVGEDARNGRLYLPTDWLSEAGIDPDAWLHEPHFSAGVARVVERVLTLAEELYGRVDAGIALLPPDCRPGISAARVLYAGIGHEVARRGHDSVSRRAVVPATRKAWMVACAMGRLAARSGPRMAPRAAPEPPLAATRFLVEAAAHPGLVPRQPTRTVVSKPRRSGGSRDWSERLVWTIELFERLERLDRLERAGRGSASARVASLPRGAGSPIEQPGAR